MKSFITSQRIYSLLGALTLLVAWKVLSLVSISEEIVPSPESTFLALIRIFSEPDFISSIFMTLLRGMEGFILSLLLALLLGIPAGLHPGFFNFINPLLVAIRSTPVISLILLAIIWFGSNLVPVFIAILTMFPVICINVIEGIRNVNDELLIMGKTYRVSRKRILTDIYLPSISPYLTGGISNALGFGWRAIIIGEVLSQPQFGIGTMMQKAQIFLLVNELIAWTVIAIVISFLFETAVRKIEKNLIKWK